MKPTRSLLAALLTGLLLAPSLGGAEDIDLFTAASRGGDPNVLIVLDNSSNWSGTMNNNPSSEEKSACGKDAGTFFCAQRVALIRLLEAKEADNTTYRLRPNVGVGLMLYTENVGGSILGGYVRFGARKMNQQNRDALIKLLKSLDVAKDNSASTENYAYLMWEAFKYYGGGPSNSPVSDTVWGPVPYAGVGNGTTKRDYPDNSTNGSAGWAGADSNWALNGSSSDTKVARYISPVSDECAKNYIILTSTSNSQTDGAKQPPEDYFFNVGASRNRIGPNGTVATNNEIHKSYADEAARYLFNSDVNPRAGVQNLITYTIAQYNAEASGNTGNRDAMIALMKSMAQHGGGSYYAATNVDKLYEIFQSIIDEIQGVNSVFVSAALPLSVNVQGLFLNQVFIGMFRPDADASPKWLGNLKQYQLKYDDATKTVRLADSVGTYAVDAATGFISAVARSYWTSVTPPDMWTNWVPARMATATDSPDGPEVPKGGAAQRLRENNRTTQDARNVYTCPLDASGNGNCGSAGSALTGTNYQFKTSSGPAFATYAAAKLAPAFNLPAASDTEIDNLIAWVRGTDNLGLELGPGSPTTVRPTIHGDIVHSRPVAVNYGGRVVVFYGSNEGMLRAVEGKQTGTDAGKELWAFVAPEGFPKLNRLRQESPKVSLPSKPTPSPSNKDYFLDGQIGVWHEGTASTTTKAYIYVTPRRGGSFIYAFDVTDPDAPKFRFKLTTTELPKLGQAWSIPKVIKVRDGGTGKVVLIFGAGYDIAEDKTSSVDHGTAGRAIYVVDAQDGTLIKELSSASDGSSIATGIPSDVTVVDSDRDGLVDRAYVGDMAGNLWRVDLDDANPSNWKLHRLADLGSKLKFFYPPDIVLQPNYTAVMIGAGDREKPLDETSKDRFFMIKDAKVGKDGTGQTAIVIADLATLPAPDAPPLTEAQLDAKKGWYYDLRVGEKVVNGPLTIGGVVYFGTNKPVTGEVCKNDLGEARSYAFYFNSGQGAREPGGSGTGDDAYSIVLTGGGLPPTPVAGLVDLGDPVGVVPVCIGCGDRRSAFEAGMPKIDPNPVRRKTFWKVKKDN